MLFFVHQGLVCIDVYLCYGMVFLFCLIELEIEKSPDHNSYLPSHIVYIILRFYLVSGPFQYSRKCISDDRIPDMADMQRSVRVCRCVLKNYFTAAFQTPEKIPFN